MLDDPLALHDLDVLERDRGLHRVAAEGDPVGVHALPSRNGSMTASRAITAPIDAYAEDRPFAQVTMSGRMS